MRIHVDQDRCEGHGRCYSIAPQLFEPDDIGNSTERGNGSVAADQEQLATRAAGNCPEQAVIVEED